MPVPSPDLSLEQALWHQGHTLVAGVDEVGRGPLAGPVVAAAVILPVPLTLTGLNDSKTLVRRQREMLASLLLQQAMVGFGQAEVEEIDTLNIRQAALLAMRRAMAALPEPPSFVLVDGRDVPAGLPCPGQAVVGGDGRSLSIAAASIVAKVRRDRIMSELSLAFPAYGWERNSGYPTAEHLHALACHGITPWHRHSFAPVRRLLAPPIS